MSIAFAKSTSLHSRVPTHVFSHSTAFTESSRLRCGMKAASKLTAASTTPREPKRPMPAYRNSEASLRRCHGRATSNFAKTLINPRGLCNSVQSSTIVCNPTAPLAQLAEQLTLNQRGSVKNTENYAPSEPSAAHGAAVDADLPSAGAANRLLSDQQLQLVVDAWPALDVDVRRAIVLLIAGCASSVPRT